MPNLVNYPFRTAKVIDGKTYIEVTELNEILENLPKLGPAFQQVADAAQKLERVFGDTRKTANLLVEEMDKARGNL